ncbi:MAG: ABC transporter ATP-binding protein [Anaerolineae bacterium]|nr:ABC transporter ATP-binding protein [Anaerolineae bacterium]
MTEKQRVLRTEDLQKSFPTGEMTVYALRGISMDVMRGEFLGIIGPSGSGKSTLLGLIGGLDTPSAGRVLIDGTDITRLSERALTRIRNEKIGFVFQSFNLIPTLTALENVALPVQFSQSRRFSPRQRAREVLEMLGLGDRLHHRPAQLSGGQQQRVAIARALANNPPLLLADEPTGNLDTASSQVVMDALRDMQRLTGTTIVVVTHDMGVASEVDRLITLVDGEIASEANDRIAAQRAAVSWLKDKRATGEFEALAPEQIEHTQAARQPDVLLAEARAILERLPDNEAARAWVTQLDRQVSPGEQGGLS